MLKPGLGWPTGQLLIVFVALNFLGNRHFSQKLFCRAESYHTTFKAAVLLLPEELWCVENHSYRPKDACFSSWFSLAVWVCGSPTKPWNKISRKVQFTVRSHAFAKYLSVKREVALRYPASEFCSVRDRIEPLLASARLVRVCGMCSLCLIKLLQVTGNQTNF